MDDAQAYLRQITNEGRRTVFTKTGHPTFRWEIIDSGTGNHWLDCEVYQRAVADMLTSGNWENIAERFKPGPIDPKPPKPEQANWVNKPRHKPFRRRRG